MNKIETLLPDLDADKYLRQEYLDSFGNDKKLLIEVLRFLIWGTPQSLRPLSYSILKDHEENECRKIRMMNNHRFHLLFLKIMLPFRDEKQLDNMLNVSCNSDRKFLMNLYFEQKGK
jgi:hypothetical protein